MERREGGGREGGREGEGEGEEELTQNGDHNATNRLLKTFIRPSTLSSHNGVIQRHFLAL